MLAELTLTEDGGVVLARVQGEIDMSNAVDVGVQIKGAVPNTALGLVLDLSPTSYLDSSGLKLLFELDYRLKSRQQVLCLVAPESGAVRKLLEMVGGDKAFNMEESVESAGAQIRDRGQPAVADTTAPGRP